MEQTLVLYVKARNSTVVGGLPSHKATKSLVPCRFGGSGTLIGYLEERQAAGAGQTTLLLDLSIEGETITAYLRRKKHVSVSRTGFFCLGPTQCSCDRARRFGPFSFVFG